MLNKQQLKDFEEKHILKVLPPDPGDIGTDAYDSAYLVVTPEFARAVKAVGEHVDSMSVWTRREYPTDFDFQMINQRMSTARKSAVELVLDTKIFGEASIMFDAEVMNATFQHLEKQNLPSNSDEDAYALLGKVNKFHYVTDDFALKAREAGELVFKDTDNFLVYTPYVWAQKSSVSNLACDPFIKAHAEQLVGSSEKIESKVEIDNMQRVHMSTEALLNALKIATASTSKTAASPVEPTSAADLKNALSAGASLKPETRPVAASL